MLKGHKLQPWNMRPRLITNCTHILYLLSWIVYPAFERKLGKEERMKGDAGTRKSQTNLFRKFNLLYLFVDGNLKPLLACNACVDSRLWTLDWKILQGENHLGRNARFLLDLSFFAGLWRFDKLQAKERSTPPSKNDVRICIDPRDLNKELKRP